MSANKSPGPGESNGNYQDINATQNSMDPDGLISRYECTYFYCQYIDHIP